MSESPYARLQVSKTGLLLGLALLAFGLYTAVSYFRSGGQGHAMTTLRALLAIPVGCVVVYLSFSTVCSGCNKRLARNDRPCADCRLTPPGPPGPAGQRPRDTPSSSSAGRR
jgi:hypothetical protein